MSDLKTKPLRLLCDFELVDSTARKGWLLYLDEWARHSVRSVEVVEATVANLGDLSTDFAFVSGAATLSRKLINTFDTIVIKPTGIVACVDAWLFSRVQNANTAWFSQLFDVSLITSVYAGDEYLDGFLENTSMLDGYDRCQHFLVRAGSLGNELERLFGHVLTSPNAVLINLERDPGLYEVWNSAVRLSTARYVSNANLDDRRAPAHIAKLVQVLEANPGVDVASSELRVSRVKNLRWEDSSECEVWPRDRIESRYSGSALFRRRGGDLVSRNLPHCMPVWRRALHGIVGDFDEQRYGPSADWAFWLNAAASGAGFCFEAEPLGLYLKSASDYWQRLSGESGQSVFDAKIVADFADLACGLPSAAAELPLSLHWALVARRLEAGAVLDALTYCLEKCPIAEEMDGNFPVLLGRYHFGMGFSHDLVARYQAFRQHDRTGALLSALVDLINGQDLGVVGVTAGRVARNLSYGCTDWLENYSEQVGYMLYALLAKRCGDFSKEQPLLKRAYALGAKTFWYQIQSVYRFECLVTELMALAGCSDVSWLEALSAPVNLYYYPNVTGNPYLSLLYSSLESEVNRVQSISRLGQIPLVEALEGYENIIHVHWVNDLVKPLVSPSEQESFLKLLSDRQAKGFKIYWTIHNYVSHECVDSVSEVSFRQALYRLADRVFVHHPVAAELLDWLPDRSKLHLCEHGGYRVGYCEKGAARETLGLSDDDFIITTVGRVKPYKGLVKLLPVIRSSLDRYPKLRFVLLGRVDDQAVSDWLIAHSHPRLIVLDEYLDEQMLETWMCASDVGLLSYDKILTSGAMFHWFSMGRPVLAPTKGQIPAYVVNGWNGFAYETNEQLSELLDLMVTSGDPLLAKLTANAKAVAGRLAWGRVH